MVWREVLNWEITHVWSATDLLWNPENCYMTEESADNFMQCMRIKKGLKGSERKRAAEDLWDKPNRQEIFKLHKIRF